jgi:hypothetical protein
LKPATGSFITGKGQKLFLDGKEYTFTGVNAFNLATLPGSNAGCGGYVEDIDAYLSRLRPNSVVRLWASQGGMATNVTTKQLDWAGLDRVVAAAERNHVKLILVLGEQAGNCDDGHWRDRAWYMGGYRLAYNDLGNGLTPLPYLEYVKKVVERYKDSPAIAMWEPINEPEASDCRKGKGTQCYAALSCNEREATKALRHFFDEVGGLIKRIDPNHLVSSGVGGNGQCGAIYEDFKYIHESDGIDVVSYHDYDRNDQPMPGDPWNGLQKRIDQARKVDKPLFIGEVGMLAAENAQGCMSLSERHDKLKAKMDAQFAAGIVGYVPWALTSSPSRYCNFDIGSGDPTLDLLRRYPVRMGSVTDTIAPLSPTDLTATVVEGGVQLRWNPSTDSVGVVRYDIFRNNAYFTSTTVPRFLNATVFPGETYVYFVKAKDAAGNSSTASEPVAVTIPGGETLQSVEEPAPTAEPTPTAAPTLSAEPERMPMVSPSPEPSAASGEARVTDG